MPYYEYECETCKKRFEVFQSMNDEPLTECPTCSSPVRRVFNPSSVIFKGSGFYCNDSKSKNPAASQEKSSSSSSKSS
ncbi:MAG: zinc ribbon domain-containing protein [Sphaerochaetaceae bacterium]|nr:zinc ribbon domain-containing protein [Sphaerochaetaceae bacterium]